MIQRIQTIYLAVALGLLVVFLLMPLAVFTNHGAETLFTLFGTQHQLMSDAGNIGVIIVQFLSGMIFAILFVSVFLYKRRIKQMQFCLFSIVLVILLICSLGLSLLYGKLPETGISFRLPLLYPLVSIVFILLAYSAIKKDESLVKSYDRIR